MNNETEKPPDTNELILEEIREIKAAMAAQHDNALSTNKLWSYEVCAEYLGASVYSVRQWSKDPGAGFPAPCRPQVNEDGRRMSPRFKPDEVIKWATRREARAS